MLKHQAKLWYTREHYLSKFSIFHTLSLSPESYYNAAAPPASFPRLRASRGRHANGRLGMKCRISYIASRAALHLSPEVTVFFGRVYFDKERETIFTTLISVKH
jgi:hypothetical protein